MKKKCRVRQHDRSDCAAACIASVCKHYGKTVRITTIREYAGTGVEGTSVEGIISAAEKIGMIAKGVKGSCRMLAGMPLPAIAHVITNKHSHFVVLTEVGKRSVMIMDPATGELIKQEISVFNQMWTGVMVFMSPDAHWVRNKEMPIANRFWQLAAPAKGHIFFAIVAAVVVSALGLLPSLYIREVVDNVLAGNKRDVLDILSVMMIFVLVLQAVLHITRNFTAVKVEKSILLQVTAQYYSHLLSMPRLFFDTMRTGELISRGHDAARLSSFIGQTISGIISNVFILLFSTGFMLWYYWKLAMVLIVMMPLYGVLFRLGDRMNKNWQRILMTQEAVMSSEQVEAFGSMDTVKQLGIDHYIFRKLYDPFTAFASRLHNIAVYNICFGQSVDFLNKFIPVIIIWCGSRFVMDHSLTIGALLSFYAITGYFTGPVIYLSTINKNIREAVTAADRLFEIIDMATETSGNIQIAHNIVERIQCIHLGFRYDGRHDVLKNINLDIRKGEIVAIKGKSGCGKSTLASLLQHLYEPCAGRIMINGIDMKYIDNGSLRQSILTISPYSQLFTDTIAGNITIGVMEPNPILFADIAARTGVTEFVQKLPLGFDTLVSEQGSNLSAGQKQKVTIARALYRQPSVLIVDEATSAMDPVSEEKIMQTFAWYREKGNTIIIIAHCPAAMKICDRIIYIENGRIKNDI